MSDTPNPVASATQSLILKNAISSLRIGLEDYNLSEADPDRILSSIRNVYASLLLFLKEGLCRLSPLSSGEEFIKARLEPVLQSDGSLGLTGVGNTTIDVEGIQQRYKLLRIKIDWKPLTSIQQERNNIEHLYSTARIAVLQSVICEASTFIIDMSRIVFHTDPTALLGHTWKQMSDIKDIYNPIKERCNKSLAPLSSTVFLSKDTVSLIEKFSCSKCGSKLMYLFTGPDEPSEKVTIHLSSMDTCELVCYACHARTPLFSAFEYFAYDEYCPSFDGHNFGISQIIKKCPECGNLTFIDNEAVNSCLYCGYTKMNEVCNFCEEPLTLEQDFEGVCEHCEYMLSEP